MFVLQKDFRFLNFFVLLAWSAKVVKKLCYYMLLAIIQTIFHIVKAKKMDMMRVIMRSLFLLFLQNVVGIIPRLFS